MEIDVEKLAEALAEQWFDEYSKYINPKDLYDIELQEGHGLHVTQIVKDEHSTVFWNRVQFYKELISNYEIT